MRIFKRLPVLLVLFLVFCEPALAVFPEEICGSGFDELGLGTYGSCPGGYMDAAYSHVGCDRMCPGLDPDMDGYYSDGNGPNPGIDCDNPTTGKPDKMIFPGVATDAGCAVNSTHTCQLDGTFTACTPVDYCPSKCTAGCRYIEPISGSDSNNGLTLGTAWKTQLKIVSYYTPANQPAGYDPLAPGRCVFVGPGTLSTTYDYNGITSLMKFRAINGTSSNHIYIENRPGYRPIVNGPGNSGAPDRPFSFEAASYFDIAGFEVTGNYCNDNEGNAGCIGTDSLTGATFSRMAVHDNDGDYTANTAGFAFRLSTNNTIRNSGIWDNYDHRPVHPDIPMGGGVFDFSSDGVTLLDSTILYTTNRSERGFMSKHGTYKQIGPNFFPTPKMTLKRNFVLGTRYAIALAAPSWDVQNNFLENYIYALQLVDNGGPTYHTGDMKFLRNTLKFGKFFLYNPQKRYNKNQTGTASLCTGNAIPIASPDIRDNIVVDNSASYPSELEFVQVGKFFPDAIYDDVIVGHKLGLSDNCYFNTLGTSLVFSLFSTANSNFGCQEGTDRGVEGADYANLAAFQVLNTTYGNGFDNGTIIQNPALDADNVPYSAGCLNKGFTSFEPAPTPTPTPTATPSPTPTPTATPTPVPGTRGCSISQFQTLNIERRGLVGPKFTIVVMDKNTCDGKTALNPGTTGLRISVKPDNAPAAISFSANDSKIDSIPILGSYFAPAPGTVRWREVDPVRAKGAYEIQLSREFFLSEQTRRVDVCISGVPSIPNGTCLKVNLH